MTKPIRRSARCATAWRRSLPSTICVICAGRAACPIWKPPSGRVLQIKPLLKGDPQGKIVCFAKLRGRQRAVEAIARRYEELVVDAQEQTVGIAHADCAPDAQILASLLRRSSKPPKKS